MPPKPKLHKTTGKSTKSIQQPSVSSTENSVQPSTINPQLEQQFEVELCWCIEQLQKGLNSGKLNQKQIQENTKALNTLMSNSAPMVKKRQVMRLSFGDYRAKMAEEDKKLSKAAANIKITPGTPDKKSVFVKKSIFGNTANGPFKFDFDIDESHLVNNLNNVNLKEGTSNDDKHTDKFKFSTSDNGFKFNFSIDNQ